jgi:hypothetical protein
MSIVLRVLVLACIGSTAISTPAQAPAPTQKFASFYSLTDRRVPAAVKTEATPKPWTGPETGPVAGLREWTRETNGAIWLGSEQGAARFDPRSMHRWDRWQYFYGRRWLPDNAVRQIVVDETGGSRRVWIRTAEGVAQIEWRPMTLEQKAAHFDERIEARHVRHGMVADSRLRVPGDLTSNVLADNDNDGLWTAMYLGAQAYRYKVTGSADARNKARRSVQLLIRLEEITGHPGFPARSFVEADRPHDHGEWHPTPDGRWRWKGDTSSDEIVGHYFGHALYFDLVANDAEKVAIRNVIRRLTDHLIRHDYELIDLDGKPTRWGQWSERYFKTEEGTYEAALRAIELLAFLKTAHHITGDAKYAEAYRDRIQRGYARHMKDYRRWPGGGEINFSDDELAYLSYDPLLRYEKDPELRAIYLDGLRFTWSQVRRDMNPLWNYISVASGAGPLSSEIREESRRALERIPVDMVEWNATNSHRRDVTLEPATDRFSRPQIKELLAPDERAVEKWNSNPFIPDGGKDGRSEDDGAYFLLPYWMGRHLQAVE